MPDKSLPPVHVSAEETKVQHATTGQSDPRSLQGEAFLPEAPCSAIMTSQPVCCEPGDPVDVVARLMVVEDIGAVPVVNSLNELRPIGMVTDRDLTVKVVAEGHDPKSVIVDEVMTRTALTCAADGPIQQAIDLMAEHQVRRVPIVDAEHRLVGIIAQADIAARLVQPAETARVVREISQSVAEPAAVPGSSPMPSPAPPRIQNTSREEQAPTRRGGTAANAGVPKRRAKAVEGNDEKRGGATGEAGRRASTSVNKRTDGKNVRNPARDRTGSTSQPSSQQSPQKPASSRTRKTSAGARRG